MNTRQPLYRSFIDIESLEGKVEKFSGEYLPSKMSLSSWGTLSPSGELSRLRVYADINKSPKFQLEIKLL